MSDHTHQECWYGTHRGIIWEIKRTDGYSNGKDRWCYYISVSELMIPPDELHQFNLPAKAGH